MKKLRIDIGEPGKSIISISVNEKTRRIEIEQLTNTTQGGHTQKLTIGADQIAVVIKALRLLVLAEWKT